MEIPDKPRWILERLRSRGFAAYAVGGCVRDTLLGRVPGDWDICTAALPEETEAVFSDCRCIETGLKHGTVTVRYDGEPFEITTFRRDGAYTGHRRPEQVQFVSSLQEDLGRRDFTINAMALDRNGDLQDFFGGQEDLRDGVIRCVGDPDRRFQEDALRILRALRFAARLEFSIDPETAGAMLRNRDLLRTISGERIYKELTGMLVGPGVGEVLTRYASVLIPIIPEIAPAMGFDQHSPYHDQDVWGHTITAIGHSKPDPWVRWALLLHDLGKPETFTLDHRGVGHFYGHPERSEAIARDLFTRLHTDKASLEAVCSLVRHHDAFAPVERKHVLRWLSRYGQEQFFRLMEVQKSDTLAHVESDQSVARFHHIQAFADLGWRLLQEEPCLSRKDLKVNGRDVMALGVTGPEVGACLDRLLQAVMEGTCPNKRPALLARLSRLCQSGEDTYAD